jgi:hypothetical protein
VINVPVISFRISEKLKKEMAELDINWPEFIRETIEKQVELEKRVLSYVVLNRLM